ncbi:MAG: hypothetical protein LC732_10855 [Acidobacteria bacterium]|nr:hypothetical protein [Acidobacteriota bacterium]
MRRRLAPWAILFLLAALVSTVPAVLYPDQLNPPPAPLEGRIEVEQRIFAALAVPPSVLTEFLGRERTAYARVALAPGEELPETLASPLALEHAAGAVPFWFVLLVSTWELARHSRRRMREADARKIARFRLSDPI